MVCNLRKNSFLGDNIHQENFFSYLDLNKYLTEFIKIKNVQGQNHLLATNKNPEMCFPNL